VQQQALQIEKEMQKYRKIVHRLKKNYMIRKFPHRGSAGQERGCKSTAKQRQLCLSPWLERSTDESVRNGKCMSLRMLKESLETHRFQYENAPHIFKSVQQQALSIEKEMQKYKIVSRLKALLIQ